MSKQKRALILPILFEVLGFAFLFFVWWLSSFLLYQRGNELLPYPQEVFKTLGELLFQGGKAENTWQAVGWTLLRLAMGFGISFILGAIIGTLAGLFKIVKSFSHPFIVFSKSMPTAAFVLILVGVFFEFRGLSPYTPCFLVFLVAFPVIYESFVSGVEGENPDEKDALSLDGGWRSFPAIVQVLWPDSLDYILLGIAQSLGLSMKVSVMSEILVNSSTSQGGIGGLIQNAKLYLGMDEVLAYSIIAVCLVLVIDIPLFLFKKKLQKKLG